MINTKNKTNKNRLETVQIDSMGAVRRSSIYTDWETVEMDSPGAGSQLA